jgi:hypothetical protein
VKRRLLGTTAIVGLVGLAMWPVGGAPSVAAADAAPSVSVSATAGITDGQVVTVTVRATPDAPAEQARALLCRHGVAYKGSTTKFPSVDAADQGANCPGTANPISSSADSLVNDSNMASATTPDGESFLYRLGSGIVKWHDATTPGSPEVVLTCDQANPCDLVVELQFTAPGGQLQWKPYVFTIGYGSNDPIANCGGAAADALQTGGSDRMQDAWIAWTLGTCAAHPAVHAPTRASFLGEGTAVAQFSTGALDVAYTAGGYDKDMAKGSADNSGLVRPDAKQRPSVAVPIALNATVLGVGGGVQTPDGHKVPYKNIKLTAAQMAAFVSGGRVGLESVAAPDSTPSQPRSWADDIRLANPQLSTGLFDASAGFADRGIAAFAGAEASSWYATRWLKAAAPSQWVVPDLPHFVGDRGKQRGVDAALGQALPSYERALATQSGRPAFVKALIGPGANTQGGEWVLADLQTTKALGLPPVMIPDSTGSFVAPTAATLTAAVPAMKPDDQGILIMDPKATPPGAYPLTFVEFAQVPTEPLLNDDCTTRPQAQKLLTDWLSYVTTDGQAKLPAGLAPLPDSLKTQAAAAIQKVGASAVTGKCANTTQPPTIASPSASAPVAAAGSLPAGSAPAAGSSLGAPDLTQPPTLASAAGGSDSNVLGASGSSDAPALSRADHLASIPAYAGRRASGWGAPVLALLGIMTLSSLALLATARARPR